MRNDAAEGEEKDPIEQALGYLDRIRLGKVQTSSGRLKPKLGRIPYGRRFLAACREESSIQSPFYLQCASVFGPTHRWIVNSGFDDFKEILFVL
ncbi:MAG: hypothetical protein DRH90_24590 [Deltaproteobacteria bacterium]|nr:MAG: hypothetical protein DRH90_24590 [Deltaproteobacteria bacterium]